MLRRGNELKLVFPQPGFDPSELESLEFEHFFLQPMDGPNATREHAGGGRLLSRAPAVAAQHPDPQAARHPLIRDA